MKDVEQARFDQQYAKHVNALKLQGVARTSASCTETPSAC